MPMPDDLPPIHGNQTEEGDTDEYIPATAATCSICGAINYSCECDSLYESEKADKALITELTAQRDELLKACELSEYYQAHVLEGRTTFNAMAECFRKNKWDRVEPPANFVSRKRQEAIARCTPAAEAERKEGL